MCISTTFYPFSLTLCFNATASEQTIWKSWISRNSPSRKVLFVGPLSNLLLLMESAGRTQYYWIWILVTCQWPFFFGLYVPWAMAPRSCNAHISFNLTLILARTTQLPALGAITQKCNTFFFCCRFILLPFILKALLPPKLQRRGLVFKGKLVTMERVWWVTMERVWWVTLICA